MRNIMILYLWKLEIYFPLLRNCENEYQSWARDNFLAARQWQRDNILELGLTKKYLKKFRASVCT